MKKLIKFCVVACMLFTTSFSHAIIYNLPNKSLTPGAVAPDSMQAVCSAKYTIAARKVSEKTKREVYDSYGTSPKTCEGGCKIDHLIPLAIGGSNDKKNLWPHAYKQEWSVAKKTRLEVKLRKEVCSGKMDVTDARLCISNNWINCYQRHYTLPTPWIPVKP